MGKPSSTKLKKRAGWAENILSFFAAIGVLVTIGAIIIASISDWRAADAFKLIAGSLVLVTSGYWTLAKAAKRGNPSSVTIVLFLQLATFIAGPISRAQGYKLGNIPTSQTQITVSVSITLFFALLLLMSRSALVKLKERGLWQDVFGGYPPSGHLCLFGAILLALGSFGALKGTADIVNRPKQDIAQEKRQAELFLAMVSRDEPIVEQSMKKLTSGGAPSKREVETVVGQLTILERKAHALSLQSAKYEEIAEIFETYSKAAAQWKRGVMILTAPAGDVKTGRRALELGDTLRQRAFVLFDEHYAK
jgi:hypothetical protein